jgi:glutaredoxin
MKLVLTDKDYTVFTVSECIYCEKVKDLLSSYDVNYVVCDDYLLDILERQDFLRQMDTLSKSPEHRTFPFVFMKDTFIGGYEDLKKIIDQQLLFDEEDF